MKQIESYVHQVGSHCESGTVRNLLKHAGIEVSEPMVFALGSGPAFYYLFFVKGPSTMPLIGLRNTPGSIFKRVGKLCGVDWSWRQFSTARKAMAKADALIDRGVPVAAQVEMFRMKYLPEFLRVRAPFHFIALVGRDPQSYAVSDPYHAAVNRLARDDLEAGWETHAPMAKDNLLVHLRKVPRRIDWKRASREAIRHSCSTMLLPPGVGRLFFFVGIEGMRTFARQMRRWTTRYRGVRLREGMLFQAVGFEDQGTGGGAFRLMYGAFLQEAAELFHSPALGELGERYIAHGREWRKASRTLVELARTIPMEDERYDDWHREHGRELSDGVDALAGRFEAFAQVEATFYRDLRRLASRLS
jgi:hypothetical protein